MLGSLLRMGRWLVGEDLAQEYFYEVTFGWRENNDLHWCGEAAFYRTWRTREMMD